MNALGPLLSGIVDYAGLFPPAALDTTTAVANYASYLESPDAWMLGRFVVPVARLDEFSSERATVQGSPVWLVTALLGDDAVRDIDSARAFNATHREMALIDTLEGKFSSAAAIERAADAVRGEFALFAEIPATTGPAPLIAAVKNAGVAAKIRTGGTAPEAFPSAEQIVRFMRTCITARVPFKATAGLHHPLRAEYRLTYDANAPRGAMFGYLNVFLAAAFLANGMRDSDARELLEERDPRAIVVEDDVVRWHSHEISAERLGASRTMVATSFGSCSFREPVDEAKALAFLS